MNLSSSQTKEYLLLVRAADHAPQPRSASLPVRITVTVATDAPPTWASAPLPRLDEAPTLRHGSAHHQAYQVVEISEWAPRGVVIAVMTATNPTTSLLYEIPEEKIDDDCPSNMFVVTPSSGVVSLAGVLDRETCAWYNISVTATNFVSKIYSYEGNKIS